MIVEDTGRLGLCKAKYRYRYVMHTSMPEYWIFIVTLWDPSDYNVQLDMVETSAMSMDDVQYACTNLKQSARLKTNSHRDKLGFRSFCLLCMPSL
jgi:hypothetical protein